MSRPPLLTLLLLALGMLVPPATAAAEDVLAIPESCGSAGELASKVAQLRGEGSAAQRPEVRLAPEAAGYVLEVRLPEGVRVLREHDCRALFEAAVLIAALGVDAPIAASADTTDLPRPEHAPEPGKSAAAQLTPPPATPIATTTTALLPQRAVRAPAQRSRPPAEAPAVERASSPAPSERERTGPTRVGSAFVRYHAQLALGVAYGAVPAVALASRASLAAELARFGARLSLHYVAKARERDRQGQGVRVDALGPGLTLSWLPRAWLGLGLGGDVLLLRGQGLSLTRARTDWATLPLLHAEALLRLFAWGPLWLELPLRVSYTPRPARFLAEGVGPLYQTARVGFMGGVALSLRFL